MQLTEAKKWHKRRGWRRKLTEREKKTEKRRRNILEVGGKKEERQKNGIISV